VGIDIQWEDERGELLDRISDDGDLVGQILAAARTEDSACLRFVDRYGDTVFNQPQIPVLVAELEAVPDDNLNSDARTHRQKIVGLATRARSKVHTYLKFYGD